MILLGSYKLDIEEMLLSRNGETVVLEPKVLEVLLYFIENNKRYITMEELHENLWQGRIVSDAAVRRIISKLRNLLNDDHKAPTYIKSLSKRGYKLICNIDNDEQSTGEKLSANSINQNMHIIIDSGSLKKNNINHTIVTLFSFFLVLLVASTAYFQFNTSKIVEDKTFVTTKIIKSLPGKKIAVSQSLDNQFLAFSGKVNEEQGYQIFIKKNKAHDFIPVNSVTFFPLAIAFSADNKNLFYSDLKEGNSSLNRISLTNSIYRAEKLLQDYFSIGDVFTSINTENVYFSGQKKKYDPHLIYSYNIKTKEVNPVTHSTHGSTIDSRGSIAPNGRFLATVRYSEFIDSYELRVINLISKNIIFRQNTENFVYNIQWLDNQYLLLLDKSQLSRIDIKSSKIHKIINKPHNFKTFHIIDNHKIIAIEDKKLKRIFFEQMLPFNNWSNKSIYNDEASVGIFSMKYPIDSNSRLIMTYKDNITRLGKLNTRTSKVTYFLQTEYKFSHFDYSPLNNLDLIQMNHRFALFNKKTNNLVYITSADEFIGDASFSNDEESVLFSIKSNNQWEIKCFNIENKSLHRVLKGFRYIRPYKKDYIVADAQENLFFYNNTTQEKIALNNKISYEPNTYWAVHGNYIYWSNHDLVTTTFFELNINDIEQPTLTKKSFDYGSIRPYFSIMPDGSSMTHSQRREEDSTIKTLLLE